MSTFGGDFVSEWTTERYVEAQRSLEAFERYYPRSMHSMSFLEHRHEMERLTAALAELNLERDAWKLKLIGVRQRRMLAVVVQEDIDRLGLEGTLAQFRTVYEPALEEFLLGSPDCEQGDICHEQLYERLVGVKQLRDREDEDERRQRKKQRDKRDKEV